MSLTHILIANSKQSVVVSRVTNKPEQRQTLIRLQIDIACGAVSTVVTVRAFLCEVFMFFLWRLLFFWITWEDTNCWNLKMKVCPFFSLIFYWWTYEMYYDWLNQSLPAFEEGNINWRWVEVDKLEDENFEDEHVFIFWLSPMHLWRNGEKHHLIHCTHSTHKLQLLCAVIGFLLFFAFHFNF